MKTLAVTIAVIGFFVLATIGWACGASPYGCGMKAAAGAVIIYLLARVSGRVLIGIVADGIVRDMLRSKESTEEQSE